jgi:hypothetical protein
MATFYIRQRLKGPIGIVTVQANTREAAIAILAQSAAPGTEYDVLDASTVLATTGTTGPTAPSGMTGFAMAVDPTGPTGLTGPSGPTGPA